MRGNSAPMRALPGRLAATTAAGAASTARPARSAEPGFGAGSAVSIGAHSTAPVLTTPPESFAANCAKQLCWS